MRSFTLTVKLIGKDSQYVEDVDALTDREAIELAELAIEDALSDGEWCEAVLTDETVGKVIWRRFRHGVQQK